jgi:hypothetical protein
VNDKIKQRVKIYAFLFVFFCVITIYANTYGTSIDFLEHSDKPNHFFGGVIVGIPLFVWTLPEINNRWKKVIITVLYLPVISVIGFGWEVLEIAVFESGWSPGTLFEETAENKVADLFLGLLGFISTSYLVLGIKIKELYRAGKYELS